MNLKYLQKVVGFILLGLMLSINFIASAQEEEVEEEIVEEFINQQRQIITYSTLLELMLVDEEITSISNFIIKAGQEDEKLKIDNFSYYVFKLSSNIVKSKKRLFFHNCRFILNDDEYLLFKNWMIEDFQIVGCEFLNQLTFENIGSKSKSNFFIENSSFKNQVSFIKADGDNTDLKLKNNDFNADLIIESNLQNFLLDNCRFIADTMVFKSKDEVKTYYQLSLNNLSIEKAIFLKNTFDNYSLDDLYSLDMEYSELEELEFLKNTMQSLNLSNAMVEKSLLIDSLFVDDYIGILNFDFPDMNTNVPWYNVGDEKFAVFISEEKKVVPFQAKTDNQLANNLVYNDLMSAYNKFNSMYHSRGDITSANHSYVEIKDIETRRQAFIQTVNPSTNNLINYNLNRFLRIFSDYATNPGKSLKHSLYVILFFTFLYMISFSKWDKLNSRFYILQYRLFAMYLTKDASFKDIYQHYFARQKNMDAEIKAIREKYRLANKEMPSTLKLMSWPLTFIGRFGSHYIIRFLVYFNFQPKRWASLSGLEKLWSGFMITVYSILFFVSVFIVKFLTSFIMSLNSFVVIGFGSLPEEDSSFAMYLSIIEGIIGWFLLTIFTITLLSQVLQST